MREKFEQSIGEGPPPPPVTAHLTAGKKALRRRRFVVGAGGVAGALILGTAGWGIVAGGGASGVEKPAGPAATDEPSSDPSKKEISLEELRRLQQKEVSNFAPIAYFSRKKMTVVVVKDGWRITRRVANPMNYRLPYRSLGAEVTNGKVTKWALVTLDPYIDKSGNVIPGQFGASSAWDPPNKGYTRLQDWLDSMVDINPPHPSVTKGSPSKPILPKDLARLEGDQIVAMNGAKVVEQREIPRIADWRNTGGQSAKVTHNGRTWFLNFGIMGGQADMIPVDAEVLPEPTFEALFDYLRAQHQSGEGVR